MEKPPAAAMLRRLRQQRPARAAHARPGSRTGLVAGATALLLTAGGALPARSASALLESVKQNPALAQQLCQRFRQFNAAGKSATSKESIAMVASSQNLSPIDAEVLTTYVIGLHCPEVR